VGKARPGDGHFSAAIAMLPPLRHVLVRTGRQAVCPAIDAAGRQESRSASRESETSGIVGGLIREPLKTVGAAR